MNAVFLETGNALVHLSMVKMFPLIELLGALVPCFR